MEPKNMYTQDSDNDGLTDAQELALVMGKQIWKKCNGT